MANWWWEKQKEIPAVATTIPILLASDCNAKVTRPRIT